MQEQASDQLEIRSNVLDCGVVTPQKIGREFSAVSYNVHQCVGLDGRRDVARVARVLSHLDAHLIGLQEVGTDFTGGRKSGQMEQLAKATGLQAIAGHTIELQTGPYGNVLLTSWRVLNSRLLDLSLRGREPRGAIDAELAIGGETVRVVVTHLGLHAAERRYQVRRLLEVGRYQRVDPQEPSIALAVWPLRQTSGAAHLSVVVPSFCPRSYLGHAKGRLG
jgi:endonuclease/exonuclease/phosphatase family metal-dependent hydrolase